MNNSVGYFAIPKAADCTNNEKTDNDEKNKAVKVLMIRAIKGLEKKEIVTIPSLSAYDMGIHLQNEKDLTVNTLKSDVVGRLIDLPPSEEVVSQPYQMKLPIIYRYFEELYVMFDFMQHMKDKSLVTNRHTLMQLGLKKTLSEFDLSIVEKEVAGDCKSFYVLSSADPVPVKRRSSNIPIGAQLEAAINGGRQDYYSFTLRHRRVRFSTDRLLDVYYTCQDDLYDAEGKPLEVKAMYRDGELTADRMMRISFQCRLGDVENLIIGKYHDDQHARIKRYGIKEFNKLNGFNIAPLVNDAFTDMKENLAKIIDLYEDSSFYGKKIRIQKRMIKKRAHHFTFLTLKEDGSTKTKI